VESDIFEHFRDGRKVEWSIEESEERLNAFVDKATRRKGGCLKEKFKHTQSDEALQIFIALNLLILDIRKVLSSTLELFDINFTPRHSKRILTQFRNS